jgi:hypothetical protein
MEDTSSVASDTKLCPYCAETIKAAAKVCRFCGRDLTDADSAPQSYPQPVPAVQPQKKGGGCLKTIGFILLGLVALAFLSALLSPRTPRVARTGNTSVGAVATPTLTINQLQERAVTVPFDDLARNTELHEGKLLDLTGTVIQVLEDGSEAQLRMNINGNYDQTVFVQYPGYSKARVLEGDDVKMVASVDGRVTYETVLGNEVTLPALTALWLEVTP